MLNEGFIKKYISSGIGEAYLFLYNIDEPISGQVDRASANEMVDSGSIPGRVKLNTIKIGIHNFSA